MSPRSESQERLRATLDKCRELSNADLESVVMHGSSHRNDIVT